MTARSVHYRNSLCFCESCSTRHSLKQARGNDDWCGFTTRCRRSLRLALGVHFSDSTLLSLILNTFILGGVVVSLRAGQPFEVPECQVTLTFLDANHCPGAAIIFIQNNASGEALLHTGDFRFTRDMLQHDCIRPFVRPSAIQPSTFNSTAVTTTATNNNTATGIDPTSTTARSAPDIALDCHCTRLEYQTHALRVSMDDCVVYALLTSSTWSTSSFCLNINPGHRDS